MSTSSRTSQSIFLSLSCLVNRLFFARAHWGEEERAKGCQLERGRGCLPTIPTSIAFWKSSNQYFAKVEMKTAHPSKMQHVESWFSRGQSGDRYSEGRGLFEFLIRQLYSQRDPLSIRREIRTAVYRDNSGRRRHLKYAVNFFPKEKNEPMFTGSEVIPKLEQYQTPKF